MAGRTRALAFESLRNGDGAWRQFFVGSPADREVQVFISNDQNAKTRATIALGKKALLIAKDLAPHASFSLLKFEGVVTVAWQPLIKIEAMPDRRYKVQWNHAALPQCTHRGKTLDIRAFNKKFEQVANARHPGEAAIQWP